MASERDPVASLSVEAIRAAQSRVDEVAVRTPLVHLEQSLVPADVYLKLETLQPIGSFKLRGAANALALADPDRLSSGVFTASAGNMAQGVAYVARRTGLACRVVVPDHAPKTKTAAVERLGGEVLRVPFDDWWRVMETHRHPGMEGHFIHPVCDADVIAGNGTIGLEILEDLPDVDTVIVPFGGGGLSSGIATAVRAANPEARVFGCEVETAAPLAASLAAGAPAQVDYTPSFVDGIGGKSVFPEMWPLVSTLLAGSLVVTLEDVASAIRLLVERCRIVAEGAGAAPLAAALGGHAPGKKIVCIVSGGNLDAAKLSQILSGRIP